MKTLIAFTSIALAAALTTGNADAKGCIKGAIVGGVAGHYAHHHGVIGAAAGCLIGRHEANKRARLQRQEQAEHPEQH
jgi:hypothetical protein